MTLTSRPLLAALLIAGYVALAASAAPADGVLWLTDYDAARRAAHDKSLPLVIDFSTENCSWCRKLDLTTFRDPAVVKVLGERFVALHVHVAGPGKEYDLAQKLNVKGYPTIIFADPEGHVLARKDGYMDASEFGQQIDHVLAALPSGDGVQQAVQLSAPPSDDAGPRADRSRRAGQLLGLAQAAYREQHFLTCLDHCKTLKADYADLPEGVEAQSLEAKVRSDPEQLRAACDNLTDRLGEMYLDLADAFLHKDQTARAVLCLQWVLQACPGTPLAEAARGRLAQIKNPAAPRQGD